jgi:hypothetical protein
MKMAIRTVEQQSIHDAWVRAIAQQHFPYPNPGYPNRRTYTNPGSFKNAWLGPEDSKVYPDIIVLDASKSLGNVVMYAEVETAESVNQEESAQWRDYASRGALFYLYVPVGSGLSARRLSASLNIAEVYEYWVEAGVGRFQYAPHPVSVPR